MENMEAIQAEHLTCIVAESNHWDRHCTGQSFVLTDLFSPTSTVTRTEMVFDVKSVGRRH